MDYHKIRRKKKKTEDIYSNEDNAAQMKKRADNAAQMKKSADDAAHIKSSPDDTELMKKIADNAAQMKKNADDAAQIKNRPDDTELMKKIADNAAQMKRSADNAAQTKPSQMKPAAPSSEAYNQFKEPDKDDRLPDDEYDEDAEEYDDEEYDDDEYDDEEYEDEDEEDVEDDGYEDEDDETEKERLSSGDVLFRVLAGFLVFAICITAVTAVLLVTGRLNGVIDSINGSGQSAESPAAATPTPAVFATLTPTPTVAATGKPSADKDAKESDASKNDVKDQAKDSKNAEKSAETEKKSAEKDKNGETVMTFRDVEDEVTAKETTNLRNVPSQGEESFIVYILQNGETVKRTGISDEGWSRLEYDGDVVYAMSNLLTTDLTKKEKKETPKADKDTSGGSNDAVGGGEVVIQTKFTEVNDQVTPKEAVNLRKLPSVTNPDATVVVKVKNGEILNRTGINEEMGWSRVEYNGETLYCISSYVEAVKPQA